MANGKVVITGGAGFIGSHTAVELCAAGYLPVVVDNFNNSDRRVVQRVQELTGVRFPVHELDCRDRAALRRMFAAEGPCFGVIHFAAHKAPNELVGDVRAFYRSLR